MDYKKIIKSRDMRFKILNALEWVPDKWIISLQYKIKMGFWPNLKNPKRFSEKINWYKLYYRNPLMTKCADKYEVYDYVKSKGYENLLIPLLGVWENANDIDFSTLPEKFVLKTTNNSHENIIIRDNSSMTATKEQEVRDKLNNWLTLSHKSPAREWAYDGCKHRIIAEEFIEKDSKGRLVDWRMQCFNGRFEFLRVTVDSYDNVQIGELYPEGYYNRDFRKYKVSEEDGKPYTFKLEKPENWDKMIEIAEALSADFPQARVDLYNIDGKIYFGEITFYDNAGYIKFDPDEFDYKFGKYFKLPQKYKG